MRRRGDMREEWGGLKAGAGSGSSPVTRAGYQRPSCCLARHAEPACRELRSGSWKGRSSATGTTCPWENLRSGQGGAQSRSARASKPRATRAWASLREGVLGRHTQTCTRTHTRTTCVQVQMCTHPRTQTCAHVCTRVHMATRACRCSCTWEGRGCPEDKMPRASGQLSGREGRSAGGSP